MTFDDHAYITAGEIAVKRLVTEVDIDAALSEILSQLDLQRGGLLASSYEYPGRYKRWAIGFVNPPLELTTRDQTFTLTAHNDRGKILLTMIEPDLAQHSQLQIKTISPRQITGMILPSDRCFAEEERSKQPSAFTVVRTLLQTFFSEEDEHLGFYGAFGYDLVFQFEPITQQLVRADDQRDLVLYLPDDLVVVDYYLEKAFRLQYDFKVDQATTQGLPRTGELIDYRGLRRPLEQSSDHAPGEYVRQINIALDYFRRGDLFEVVPGQSFFEVCEQPPSKLFETLLKINPSPYGFLFNLGQEYLIGASPEMFVRVDGKRVETCPISGTIRRGRDALQDADQILELLNSTKDAAELTMCTDVDRNDKSRVCKPGSVRVIGRRQIELYSHLIHTVDHVEGILRPDFDALDAFLTHTWAVTVTGAPKRAAMQFLEQHERSPRRWYGGALGYLTFNGNLNTGLILRTIQLRDSIAEVRVGATVLYDSNPEAEEQETLTKGAALFETIRRVKLVGQFGESSALPPVIIPSNRRILLVDHEDSFVHTLANYIRQTGATVTTLRHGFPISRLDYDRPDLVVLSPGPGRPHDFRVAEMVQACVDRQIPLFGVCLGLQGIVEAFGGTLGVLNLPMHGKPSEVFVTEPDAVMFRHLPPSFVVGRYHSLFAVSGQLPAVLKVTAISGDAVIMAIEHQTLPIAAVQFHPESIMTLADETGLTLIHNIVEQYTKTGAQLASLRS